MAEDDTVQLNVQLATKNKQTNKNAVYFFSQTQYFWRSKKDLQA